MTSTDHALAAIWHAAHRAAQWVAETVSDTHYAQQRLNQLRQHPDWYSLNGDRAPASYGEFVFRSSGPPWREPTAAERTAGARVSPVASRDASKRRAGH
jgi:hypothetical protein